MTLRQFRRYLLTCDGFGTDGKPCPIQQVLEAADRYDAEMAAHLDGWTEDHRGWICTWSHRD